MSRIQKTQNKIVTFPVSFEPSMSKNLIDLVLDINQNPLEQRYFHTGVQQFQSLQQPESVLSSITLTIKETTSNENFNIFTGSDIDFEGKSNFTPTEIENSVLKIQNSKINCHFFGWSIQGTTLGVIYFGNFRDCAQAFFQTLTNVVNFICRAVSVQYTISEHNVFKILFPFILDELEKNDESTDFGGFYFYAPSSLLNDATINFPLFGLYEKKNTNTLITNNISNQALQCVLLKNKIQFVPKEKNESSIKDIYSFKKNDNISSFFFKRINLENFYQFSLQGINNDFNCSLVPAGFINHNFETINFDSNILKNLLEQLSFCEKNNWNSNHFTSRFKDLSTNLFLNFMPKNELLQQLQLINFNADKKTITFNLDISGQIGKNWDLIIWKEIENQYLFSSHIYSFEYHQQIWLGYQNDVGLRRSLYVPTLISDINVNSAYFSLIATQYITHSNNDYLFLNKWVNSAEEEIIDMPISDEDAWASYIQLPAQVKIKIPSQESQINEFEFYEEWTGERVIPLFSNWTFLYFTDVNYNVINENYIPNEVFAYYTKNRFTFIYPNSLLELENDIDNTRNHWSGNSMFINSEFSCPTNFNNYTFLNWTFKQDIPYPIIFEAAFEGNELPDEPDIPENAFKYPENEEQYDENNYQGEIITNDAPEQIDYPGDGFVPESHYFNGWYFADQWDEFGREIYYPGFDPEIETEYYNYYFCYPTTKEEFLNHEEQDYDYNYNDDIEGNETQYSEDFIEWTGYVSFSYTEPLTLENMQSQISDLYGPEQAILDEVEFANNYTLIWILEKTETTTDNISVEITNYNFYYHAKYIINPTMHYYIPSKKEDINYKDKYVEKADNEQPPNYAGWSFAKWLPVKINKGTVNSYAFYKYVESSQLSIWNSDAISVTEKSNILVIMGKITIPETVSFFESKDMIYFSTTNPEDEDTTYDEVIDETFGMVYPIERKEGINSFELMLCGSDDLYNKVINRIPSEYDYLKNTVLVQELEANSEFYAYSFVTSDSNNYSSDNWDITVKALKISENPICLSGDTLITLSDFSKKPIKTLTLSDMVLDKNLQPTPIAKISNTQLSHLSIYYYFDDGTIVHTPNPHRFFNIEQGFYQYLHLWNIGEHAKKIDGSTPALIKKQEVKEDCQCYGLWTNDRTYWAQDLLTSETAANEELLRTMDQKSALNLIKSLLSKRRQELIK